MKVKLYGQSVEITDGRVITKDPVIKQLANDALENGTAGADKGNADAAKLVSYYGAQNVEIISLGTDPAEPKDIIY